MAISFGRQPADGEDHRHIVLEPGMGGRGPGPRRELVGDDRIGDVMHRFGGQAEAERELVGERARHRGDRRGARVEQVHQQPEQPVPPAARLLAIGGEAQLLGDDDRHPAAGDERGQQSEHVGVRHGRDQHVGLLVRQIAGEPRQRPREAGAVEVDQPHGGVDLGQIGAARAAED